MKDEPGFFFGSGFVVFGGFVGERAANRNRRDMAVGSQKGRLSKSPLAPEGRPALEGRSFFRLFAAFLSARKKTGKKKRKSTAWRFWRKKRED
jgi:hypothetical protein